MNTVSLTGNLTADPTIRQTAGSNPTTVASMRIAVKRNADYKQTDFIPLKVFGKSAEFCEKYLHKGSAVEVQGEIQTGSYDGKDGKKVYTWDVIASRIGFGQGGSGQKQDNTPVHDSVPEADFMDIPDGEQTELPFN